MPGRTPGLEATTTFQTASNEQYYYCVEITPTYVRDSAAMGVDRMMPILDDVQVVYLRWDTAVVIEEVEVVD